MPTRPDISSVEKRQRGDPSSSTQEREILKDPEQETGQEDVDDLEDESDVRKVE